MGDWQICYNKIKKLTPVANLVEWLRIGWSYYKLVEPLILAVCVIVSDWYQCLVVTVQPAHYLAMSGSKRLKYSNRTVTFVPLRLHPLIQLSLKASRIIIDRRPQQVVYIATCMCQQSCSSYLKGSNLHVPTELQQLSEGEQPTCANRTAAVIWRGATSMC